MATCGARIAEPRGETVTLAAMGPDYHRKPRPISLADLAPPLPIDGMPAQP